MACVDGIRVCLIMGSYSWIMNQKLFKIFTYLSPQIKWLSLVKSDFLNSLAASHTDFFCEFQSSNSLNVTPQIL